MVVHDGGATASPAFDARGFLREFEALGGQVVTNGSSFAVLWPSPEDVELIPLALIEWGAVVAAAQERATYGA